MEIIDWKENIYLEMSDEELEQEYDRYSKCGWEYFPAGAGPEFISFWTEPFSRKGLETDLNVKLIFGDKHQIHLLEAVEFFKIGFAYWFRFHLI